MKYIKENDKSKVFAVVMLIILVILTVLVCLETCGMFDEPLWKPVSSYPFTNKFITLRGATW